MWHKRRSRGGGPPVRGWMFWRKGFWTRPAFFVLLALGAAVAVPFIAAQGYQDVRNEHLLDEQTWCWTEPAPCVDDQVGELDGPRHEYRAIGSQWRLWVDGETYDEFDTQSEYDDEIVADQDGLARTFTVDGDVVGIQTEGGITKVWGLGIRGAAGALLWTLGCFGALIAALDYARQKAAVRGSWWSVDGEPLPPGSAWGTLLLLPASVGILLMKIGLPWWQTWVLACVASMVATAVYLPPWLSRGARRRRRSQRSG